MDPDGQNGVAARHADPAQGIRERELVVNAAIQHVAGQAGQGGAAAQWPEPGPSGIAGLLQRRLGFPAHMRHQGLVRERLLATAVIGDTPTLSRHALP